MSVLSTIVFVTGTDTDVGKTITTAAIATTLSQRDLSVAVYKPTQAGTVNGRGDIDVVRELAGLDHVHEGIRLRYPMAPVAAAARARVKLPSAHDHAAAIQQLAATHDHVLVEGAGGLLVALDEAGRTIADIATSVPAACTAVVVCRSGLGTLNHTALTLEALNRRNIPVAGIVIGSWPQQPTDIDLSNRDDLNNHEAPLIGAIPEGAAALSRTQFRAAVDDWLQIER